MFWPTTGNSPMNVSSSAATSAKSGAPLRSASAILVRRWMRYGMVCLGSTKVLKVSQWPSRSNRTAPISMMASRSKSSPVVSKSRAT